MTGVLSARGYQLLLKAVVILNRALDVLMIGEVEMKLSPVVQSVLFALGAMGAFHATAENTTLGTNAGAAITTGDTNTLLGSEAGAAITTGLSNTLVGSRAGMNTTSHYNTMIGRDAGLQNTTGTKNTFVGDQAGEQNTTGLYNVYVGEDTGRYGTTAKGNTAVGRSALTRNIVGDYNTAVGYEAGIDIGKPNTDEPYNGNRNTAIGVAAGYDIGGGTANTVLGDNAGSNTESGDFNTFVGFQAGFDNNRSFHINDANRNTALGAYAGYTNREGQDNVWVGVLADSSDWTFDHDGEVNYLQAASAWAPTYEISTRANSNTNINRSTVLGNQSSVLADDGVSIGYATRGAQTGAIVIGTNAVNSHANAIVLGYNATSHSDNSVLLGSSTTTLWSAQSDANTSLGNSSYRFSDVFSNKLSVNATTGSAAQIDLYADGGAANNDKWSLIAANGGDFALASLATGSSVNVFSIDNAGNAVIAGDLALNSDRRLKTNITSIDNASALVRQLDGKRYQWKPELKRDDRTHVGLIAQEVEKVLPELIIENEHGIKSVNYVALTPVLINAIKEQQVQLDEQKRLLEKQQQQIEALLKHIQH